jgi:predicted metal-binding membrane protein
MSGTADGVLRRDRLVISVGLLGLIALAWLYLWIDARQMHTVEGMDNTMGMAMPAMATPWSPSALGTTFAMWAVMMVAMMLPSALPAIVLYAGLVRKHRAAGSTAPAAWVFTTGYLAVWTVFSLAAALLQATLEQTMLLSPTMASTSRWLSGGLLILAGVYQWLPAKDACLQKCRTPLSFFMFRWRPGTVGAFRMGAEHGAFCVGCCWSLMLLLFVAGVMNLVWIALLAALVLTEKLLPAGDLIGRSAGVLLAVAGILTISGVI